MPQIAVIPVGENDYGHPSMDVLERLGETKIYRTDECGTLEFITDGHRLWVK
jgi:competence protein ComEC